MEETIILTPHQDEVLTAMKQWINDTKTVTAATLSGSAGVGKTTVLKFFIQHAKKRNALVVTAPTHKAKKVVERMTDTKSQTIQKLLGLRPDTDLEHFNVNKPVFDVKAEVTIQDYNLVMIDEASMLNKDLYDMIIKKASEYGSKILFIGDDKQLPPVNESCSLVFTPVVPNQFKLTELVRQKHTNPLVRLLIALRKDIEHGTNEFNVIVKETPLDFNYETGEGYTFMSDNKEFADAIIKHFTMAEYKANPDFVKYTAYTNECVTDWNKYIRKKIFPTTHRNIEAGEVLMSYNSASITIDKQMNPVITNSDDYVIDSVTEDTSNYRINGYLCVARNISTDEVRKLFIVKPESYGAYNSNHERLLGTALSLKGRAWTTYYNFRAQHLLMHDIKQGNRLITKKDIDYGYCITTHKTQGSTYENIFINGNNLNFNRNALELKKLWYVALSRASKKAFILLNQ